MKTEYLTPDLPGIRRGAEIIRGGGLVAFPTETVYGLGGDAMDAAAAKKIYAAKGRPSDNPLIVHLALPDPSEMARYAAEVPEDAVKLAEALWPGPLTMVLPKRPELPDSTTGGLDTVGLRCPYTEAARQLIGLSGTAIAAPSANLSGKPSPTTWQDVREDMDGRIDAIIMGEPCSCGIESTVLDLTGDVPTILRPGWYPPYLISHILGKDCVYDPALFEQPGEDYRPKAPGMKYRHYAPQAEMTLFSGEPSRVRQAIEARKQALEAQGKKTAALLFDPEDPKAAARQLFAALREFDRQGVDAILATALPADNAEGFSVMNRMLKAASYHIEEV